MTIDEFINKHNLKADDVIDDLEALAETEFNDGYSSGKAEGYESGLESGWLEAEGIDVDHSQA